MKKIQKTQQLFDEYNPMTLVLRFLPPGSTNFDTLYS